MPTYTIEMLWKCRFCQKTENRGLSKHCPGCGHPKDDQDEEYFPADTSEANAIRDSGKLAAANAGPDWKCSYCQSLQSATHKCCDECGCDKVTGERLWLAKVERLDPDTGVVTETVEETGSTATSSVPDDKPVVEGLVAHAAAPERAAQLRGRVQRIADNAEEDIRRDRGQRERFEQIRIPLTVVCVAAVFGLLLWLIFRTRVVDASVTALAWEHRVHIDRYQTMPHEGWDPPYDAVDRRDLGPRVHHHDHVKIGSHQEHHTVYDDCRCTTEKGACHTEKGACTTTPRTCRSNKNGSATCSGGDRSCSPDRRVCDADKRKCDRCPREVYETIDDYEEQARYQEWFTWLAWEWIPNRIIRRSGSGLDTAWPDGEALEPPVPFTPGQQERSHREAVYKVTFTDSDKETHAIEPKSLDEFEKYPAGRRVKLKLGVAHGVEVMP